MPARRTSKTVLRRASCLALVTLLGSLLSACAGASAEATVSRIIDGDTLVASYEGAEKTVRLLSVDTPETKDPDKPVECMGPEATKFLERRLPAGSKISLQFDKQHQDSYGRVLAAVFDADERLVDADIARAGFGVAKRYEPNTRFYDRVLEAQREAERSGLGLYDPEASCTLPAMVTDATAGVAKAEAFEPEGQSAAAIAAVAITLHGEGGDLRGLHDLLRAPSAGIIVRAYSGAKLLAFGKRVDDAIARTDRRYAALSSARDSAASAEKKRSAKATPDSADDAPPPKKVLAPDRRASPPRADKPEGTKKKAPASGHGTPPPRQGASPHHDKSPRHAPPPEKKRPAAPPKKDPAPKEDYPGYHGPRCYAPGGKTWKPCP